MTLSDNYVRITSVIDMKIIKVAPRGYCQGVVRAINIVKEARENYDGPIYVLGMIVHNSYVTRALEEYHIISLDTSKKTKEAYLSEIKEGKIIFTAHGVSSKVYEAANNPNVTYIDASCPNVLTTQKLIKEKHAQGYKILYIGKAHHPEAESIIDSYNDVTLICNRDDIDQLELNTSKIYVTNQTTMSIYDTKSLIDYIAAKYPKAEFDLEICNATKIRQEAIKNVTEATVLLVVGDVMSNNSNKLLELNTKIPNRHLISSVQDIDLNWFKEDDVVAITSGASTPTYLTNQVITYLEQLDLHDEKTYLKPHTDIKDVL